MTSYKTFQDALRTTGGFTSAGKEPSAGNFKPSSIHSLLYAGTIIGIVSRCAIRHLLRKFDHEDWARICMASISFAERTGIPTNFEGFTSRADYAGPVVYVSNHMSTLETMIFPTTLLAFGKLAIILKKSLHDIPLVGAASRHIGSIEVSRTNAREDLKTVLEVGSQRLAAGSSVLLFPQGTRQAVFDGKRFNSLGSKLAERAGVPLVPLAVKTDCFQTGKWIKDFGVVDISRPIRIACGPLLPASLGARNAHEQSVAFIESKLREWDMPIA